MSAGSDANSFSSPAEPVSGFSRLVFKIRHGGLGWIIKRVRSEWILPTTSIGKATHAMFRGAVKASFFPVRLIRRWAGTSSLPQRGVLYACYDLKVEPITHDFLWFLAGADLTRRNKGFECVHVVIAPGPDKGVREEDALYEIAVDRDARRWRIVNILMNSVALLPTCSGLTLAGSRKEAGAMLSAVGGAHYPYGYESSMPTGHHPNDCLIPSRNGIRPIGVLCATPQGLRYIDKFIANFSAGRRLITITIRDYAYGRDRNSNLNAWSTFAKGLDPAIWWVVFVLDTERTMDPVPEVLRGFDILREASWNIGIRMALYERTWLNLGVNTGPMVLCWLNDRSRYLTFKIVTPTVSQTTVAFNRSRGFEPDESLPFATPFQKWVWEDDTVDAIEREFQSMVGVIEAHERSSFLSSPA